MLKRVAETLPLLYVIAVGMGFLYHSAFFTVFRIPIAQYMSVSELLIGFLPVLLYIGVYLVCMIWFNADSLWEVKIFRNRNVLNAVVGFTLIAGYIAYYCHCFFSSDGSANFSWLVSITLPICFITYNLLVRKGNQRTEWEILKLSMVVVCYLCAVVACDGRLNGMKIRAGRAVKRATLYTNKDTIRLDSKKVLIGRLDAGVFYYNRTDSEYTFIPASEVRSITASE